MQDIVVAKDGQGEASQITMADEDLHGSLPESCAQQLTNYHPLSAPSRNFEFDVFLSFCGKDTRKGFTSHLYHALVQARISTFLDNKGLEKGDRISDRLQNAIESSAIAIPVFSSSYADSRWCLMELAKIVECRRSILPIFYDVDPSCVRNQNGVYETALKNHEGFSLQIVEGWRKALRASAEIAGYNLRTDGDGTEATIIQMVVEGVQVELNRIRQCPLLLPTPEILGTTAMACQKRIMELLEDPNVHKIGVWGMGAVGKTCIIRNIHNHLQSANDRVYDHIMFVEVPYEANIRHVRNKIKRQVPLRNLDNEENESADATMLKERLQGHKFLLILDDLWNEIDLQKLGIPEPNRANGCKILLTTRNFEVCCSMCTQADVKVTPLPFGEARDLFCERVGEIPDCVCDCVAEEIVGQCCGLPIGLVLAAEHLRNQSDMNPWINARDALRSSKPLNKKMKEQVFDRLRLSYDRLGNQALKDIFMACAFYTDKDGMSWLGWLVKYLIAEGLIGMREADELVRAIEEGNHQIDKLEKACMVERYSRNGETMVRIQECMRSMALDMKCDKLVYKNCRRLKHAPELEAWEKAERISLKKTSITTLPPNPKCPNLISFALTGSKLMAHIPDKLFEDMKMLLVLRLSETAVSHLPPFLCNLVNLRYLSLQNCGSLKSIKGVGNLKNLLFLYMNGSAIECLPSELSELSKLRVLDVGNTNHLTQIPGGAISKLCSFGGDVHAGKCLCVEHEGEHVEEGRPSRT